MTDRRYQKHLNSLVKQDKRTRLNPPSPRAPVPGGTGYAGKSIPEPSEADRVYYPVANGVRRIGPPPLRDPVQVYTSGLAPERAIAIGDDMYTVQLVLGKRQEIWKNGTPWVTGGFTDIACISGNSTHILIVDTGADSTAIPALHWIDRNTGLTTSSLTTGEPWHVGAALPTSAYSIDPNAVIAANETHFCLPVFGDGATGPAQGYWLYENDFTLVARIMFLSLQVLQYQGECKLTNNHLYIMDDLDTDPTPDDGFKLRVYDLTGSLLDSQDIATDGSLDAYRDFEVTDRTLYMRDIDGADDHLLAVPREAGKVTFDFSSPELRDDLGVNGGGFLTVNRDFTIGEF